VPAIPPKPSIPATSAMIRNINDQWSMSIPSRGQVHPRRRRQVNPHCNVLGKTAPEECVPAGANDAINVRLPSPRIALSKLRAADSSALRIGVPLAACRGMPWRWRPPFTPKFDLCERRFRRRSGPWSRVALMLIALVLLALLVALRTGRSMIP
jgi:hypothetical protein